MGLYTTVAWSALCREVAKLTVNVYLMRPGFLMSSKPDEDDGQPFWLEAIVSRRSKPERSRSTPNRVTLRGRLTPDEWVDMLAKCLEAFEEPKPKPRSARKPLRRMI